MKIHVWGGPMDGRIVNLPKPRPIVALEAWFVLVPAGAGEDELAALLAANTTSMVDGGFGRFERAWLNEWTETR